MFSQNPHKMQNAPNSFFTFWKLLVQTRVIKWHILQKPHCNRLVYNQKLYALENAIYNKICQNFDRI